MKELHWNHAMRRNERRSDVCICVYKATGNEKTGERRMLLEISFTPEAAKKVAAGCDSVTYAIYGTRIYFDGAVTPAGFKVYRNVKRPYMRQHLPKDNVPLWQERCGSYDLRYDEEEDLFCIDLEELAF